MMGDFPGNEYSITLESRFTPEKRISNPVSCYMTLLPSYDSVTKYQSNQVITYITTSWKFIPIMSSISNFLAGTRVTTLF